MMRMGNGKIINPVGRRPRWRPSYDLVALAICGLTFVLLWHIRSFLPVFSDSWYHLGVIRAFNENGYTLHAWWEFAPFGRPQLYSPLFHVVSSVVVQLTGLTLLEAAKWYCVVTFPLLLMSGWWAARLLFGEKVAFLTLLLLCLNIGLLFPCSLIIMPGTYALALWPYLHILLIRKNWLWSGTLLSIICYLHFGIGSVSVVSLLMFAVFKREYWKPVLFTVVMAGVVFSPWWIHLWHNRDFLNSGVARLPVFSPVFTLVAASLGLWVVHKHPTQQAFVILSILAACLLFLFTLQERFWTYGGFFLTMLGGLGLERFTQRRTQFTFVVAVLLISCVTVTPFLKPSRMRMTLPMPVPSMPGVMATPLLALIQWQWTEKATKIPEAVPADVAALAHWITENVAKDEVLITDDRLLGCRLFVLTGRATTTGLWSEVMTDELARRVAEYIRTGRGYVIIDEQVNEAVDLSLKKSFVAAFGQYAVYHRFS